jgi:hypothetical protein
MIHYAEPGDIISITTRISASSPLDTGRSIFYRVKNSVPALEPIPVVDVKFSLKDRIKRLLRGKS